MKFRAALAPLLINVVARIFTALGLTAVTYVGFDLIISRFKQEITGLLLGSGAPAGLLQMFYISGGGVVMNIMFGMLTFIVTFKSMTKLASRLGRK